jgi:hypothetical protein
MSLPILFLTRVVQDEADENNEDEDEIEADDADEADAQGDSDDDVDNNSAEYVEIAVGGAGDDLGDAANNDDGDGGTNDDSCSTNGPSGELFDELNWTCPSPAAQDTFPPPDLPPPSPVVNANDTVAVEPAGNLRLIAVMAKIDEEVFTVSSTTPHSLFATLPHAGLGAPSRWPMVRDAGERYTISLRSASLETLRPKSRSFRTVAVQSKTNLARRVPSPAQDRGWSQGPRVIHVGAPFSHHHREGPSALRD